MDSLYRAAFDAPSDELGFVSMYRACEHIFSEQLLTLGKMSWFRTDDYGLFSFLFLQSSV